MHSPDAQSRSTERADAGLIDVSVAYAGADRVHFIQLKVAPGTTVAQALHASRILEICPEIDLRVNRVGIFNRVCELHDTVAAGDRVEIYRPLLADPKEARRRRAAGRPPKSPI